MSSIRLNKNLRFAIIEAIADSYVEENPEPEIVDNGTEFLNEAVIEWLKEQTKDVYELYVNSGKHRGTGVFSATTYVGYVNQGGDWVSIDLPEVKNASGERIRKAWVLPEKYGTSQALFNMSPDSPPLPAIIQKAIDKNKADKGRIREEKKAFSDWLQTKNNYMQDVIQIIEGVNTTGQLLAAWPAVEKFIPAGVNNPNRINLPAVNFARLNAGIGAK